MATESILQTIGNISLIALRKVVPADCADILVKLEWENPTGSVKDRMAVAVISRPEADGRLRPGDTVVEVGIGYIPPLWDPSLVDTLVPVPTDDAKTMARRLAREEGIFAGTSAGANVLAAIRIGRRLGPGATVVTLAADSGLKYLDTDVYRHPNA